MNSDQPNTRSKANSGSRTASSSADNDESSIVSHQPGSFEKIENLMATMISELNSLKTQQASINDRLAIIENTTSANSKAFSIIESDHKKVKATVSDFEARIPHNIASGLVATTADINQTIQYHIANGNKTTRDLAERLTIIESSSPPDVASARLLSSVNSTMDKVAATLTAINRTSEAQYLSLRNTTELAFHRVTAPVDDSMLTMLLSWQSYRKYKHGGGSLTFLEIVDRSPDVRELYLEKARKETYPSFDFTRDDDTVFFTELIQHVFHPDGITVAIFNNIVATHKMFEFSIQAASVYKIWIFFLVRTLRDHLPETLVSQLWDKVARNAFPSSFQYSLLSHPPRTLKDFPKTIETRASLFRDTTNSPRHDSIDSYRSPPSNLHQQHGGTLSSPNHSSLHSPTRRQVAAVTTSIQEPCGNCDNPHHTTITCPHIRFCLQCDRIAEDSNHYPSDCTIDHSHESD